MALQITSMADIFTIILVFLLKGYSTSSIVVTPSAGLTLPAAEAASGDFQFLKIELSETAVQVEGQSVVALEKFKVLKEADWDSLGSALAKERERQNLIAKSNSDVQVDARVLVVADQRAPYSSIRRVLASAAGAGFTDTKLAVITGDDGPPPGQEASSP